MSTRIDGQKVAPAAYQAVLGLEQYVRKSGLEQSLIELVKLRASVMNGCAYCVDMHTKDARAAGETEQRLYAVSVWREAPFFTPKERAALAWAEAVTDLGRTGAPDDLFTELKRHFTDKEIVDLTVAIATINVWNRMAVSLRAEVGGYQPKRSAAAA